jgi:hypothetical protein
MKIATCLLALTVFLGSIMDLHNLAKVPYLLEHYRQHQMKAGHFSFRDFLALHYGEKSVKHDKEEHEKHKGLPFKTHDCTSIHSTVFLNELSAPACDVSVTFVRYTNSYQSIFASEFHQLIWQPPRQG